MLKSLMKKQLLELNSGYFMNRKTGKMRSKGGIVAYVLLFLLLFLCLGMAAYAVADMMCGAFCSLGLDWFYFAIMGLLSLALSIFGGVFNTYNSLYLAKDNELLVSMPIKPSDILICRMTGVYLMSLLYEAVVYIPTLISWYLNGNLTVSGIIFSALLFFILGLISLVLCCGLGFFVALIAIKVKNKSFITVLSTVVFLVLYYVVYFNMMDYLKNIIKKGFAVAEKFKSYAYITYIFGKAATGSGIDMLIFTAISFILSAVVFLALSKSFIKIVTLKKGGLQADKSVQRTVQNKVTSKDKALFKRELRRFLSSPIYILNCGIGLVIMLAAAVFLIIKSSYIKRAVSSIALMGISNEALPVFCLGAICIIISSCCFTASSISLEGSRLWIYKTIPVSPTDIFKAKQKLHIYLTAVPAIVLGVSLSAVLKFDVYSAMFIIIDCLLYIQLISAAGLLLNLKMPNLAWTNEAIPVKQSAPVMICLFGGWVLSVGLCVAYYFLRNTISPDSFLTVILVVLVFATRFINKYINTEGVKLFADL